MSDALTLDVKAVIEKAHPDPAELEALRKALPGDTVARKAAHDYLSSMTSMISQADANVGHRKGLALWVVGREAEAAEWLALSNAKSAVLFRGRALASCGHPAAAIEILGPIADDPRAAAAIALAHAHLGNPEGVRQHLGAVTDEADRRFLEAYAADLDGDRDAAREGYEAATEIDPDHALAHFRLAYTEHVYGDEDVAIDLYRRCLDCSCPPVNAYLNLGNVYEDRGEFSRARDCYGVVISGDASNARARMFATDAAASLDMFYDEDLERRSDRRSQVLRLPVTDFELSVRSRNCLAKMGVRTLGDLMQRTEAELLSYKNFGETSLQEIKDILAQKGLRLGHGREDASQDDRARSILESIGGDSDRRKTLDRPLADLELSVRSRHCMNVLGLKSVGDLAQRSEADLMTIKNFGQTSLNEVKQKLAELGVTLKPSK